MTPEKLIALAIEAMEKALQICHGRGSRQRIAVVTVYGHAKHDTDSRSHIRIAGKEEENDQIHHSQGQNTDRDIDLHLAV